MRSSNLVIVGRDPTPRRRLDENKPEERRSLILAALEASGATIEHADPAEGSAALELAVTLGVVSASRLDFLRTAHALWRAAPSPEPSFASPETAEQDGLVPNFFVRQPAAATESWARRLAWHATDVFTPIYADLGAALADDAAVCKRAAEHLLSLDPQAAGGAAVYALTTHPGHHASLEHYGGYCFVNHAALAFRLLEQGGRRPYLIDVDYHAGDGTASLLGASSMASLHAQHDYPYVAPDAPWAQCVPPGTRWAEYEPLLREALRRRPSECDILLLSLGYDTLDGDPCAAEGHRLALQPADFGLMRRVLCEAGLPLLVLQEGGYHMANIAAAAAAFWAG